MEFAFVVTADRHTSTAYDAEDATSLEATLVKAMIFFSLSDAKSNYFDEEIS